MVGQPQEPTFGSYAQGSRVSCSYRTSTYRLWQTQVKTNARDEIIDRAKVFELEGQSIADMTNCAKQFAPQSLSDKALTARS